MKKAVDLGFTSAARARAVGTSRADPSTAWTRPNRDVSPGQCALGGLLADPSGRHAGDQRCSDGPGP